MKYLSLGGALSLAGASLLVACAAGNHNSSTDGLAGSGGAGGSAAVTSASNGSGGSLTNSGSTNGSTGIGGSLAGVGGGVGGNGNVLAYAHTGKELFTFDPADPSLAPKSIGTFDCIGGSGQDTTMTDLAVNQSGDLWGISFKYFYKLELQGGGVHCASTTPFNTTGQVSFQALTFAPVGVLDAAKEVLVAGNTAGELWSIDATGNLAQHGTLGTVPTKDSKGNSYPNHGKAWELSGDIVFLANGGSPVGFATVRDCPNPPNNSGCNPIDSLMEIDVDKLKTSTTQSVAGKLIGQITKKSGCADSGNTDGYGSMYGVAAVGDKVIGFAHSGAIVEIDISDGSACAVQNLDTTYWDGAGVTTVAPVIVPPN